MISKITSMYAKAAGALVYQIDLDTYPSLDWLLRRHPPETANTG